MTDDRSSLLARLRYLRDELYRAIDTIPTSCPNDAPKLRLQAERIEVELDELVEAIASTGEPAVYRDSDSERSEVLVGVRKTLANLAEDAEMIEKLLADDPTPEERHELETIRQEIEATERGLAGIVRRLGN